MLTEEEARKKWCPMTRALSGEKSAEGETLANIRSRPANMINVSNGPNGQINIGVCIASACMAWRWSVTPSGMLDRGRGYCGAFGKDI